MNLTEEKNKIEESLKKQIEERVGKNVNVAVKYDFEKNIVNAILLSSLNKDNTQIEVHRISYQINEGRIAIVSERRAFYKDEVSILIVVRQPLPIDEELMVQMSGVFNQITADYKEQKKVEPKVAE